MNDDTQAIDVAIVGAGAAGVATAIFLARRCPTARIVAFDGAPKVGAKILVSGGGRCNVTNARVTPNDFYGGNPNLVKRVLKAFGERQTRTFFENIGVPLHEEEHGKLFPNSNSARTVVAALLRECDRLGVSIRTSHRVATVTPLENGDGFSIDVQAGASRSTKSHPADGSVPHPALRYGVGHPQLHPHPSRRRSTPGDADTVDGAGKSSGIQFTARCVVLATGGMSLPRTGSDGFGYRLAKKLGHSIAPTTPALDPLLMNGEFHTSLSGVSQEVELTVRVNAGESVVGRPMRVRGSMLWTHFGVSGPVALNVSRFWNRARLDGYEATITANLLPDHDFESAEREWLALAEEQPRAQLITLLRGWLPARVASAVLDHQQIAPDTPAGQFRREDRRRLLHALLAWPLPIRGTRGYKYAEVTAGGVPLDEIDSATMQSRRCPGLYLVGEILDVDGRIGGFNFQWAWSSGYVAAAGLAKALEGG